MIAQHARQLFSVMALRMRKNQRPPAPTQYPTLDEFDRKILKIVQANNMVAHREISEAVCLSVPAVARRLQRLRKLGVITADTSVLCPEFVGMPLTIMVTLSVESLPHTRGSAAREDDPAGTDRRRLNHCFRSQGTPERAARIPVRRA
jgi:DNA-binding Lrp family transcriptional regulator